MLFRYYIRRTPTEQFFRLTIQLISCAIMVGLVSTILFRKQLQEWYFSRWEIEDRQDRNKFWTGNIWTAPRFDFMKKRFYGRFAQISATQQAKSFFRQNDMFLDKLPPKTLILDWTWLFGEPIAHHPWISKCKDFCEISWDRRRILEASAVVFHGRDMSRFDLPPLRAFRQYYVFLLMEPPFMTFENLTNWNGFFNWTMTHRSDSDVYLPYGLAISKETAPIIKKQFQDELLKTMKGKKKFAAWIVSHCDTHSRRDVIAAELGKYIPLDIYGRCGSLSCGGNTECSAMLDKDYKFYLSFENSVCKDYVTEKLLSRIHASRIIPITLKRSIAASHIPSNAFIAVDDFNSYQELSDYLHFLNRNLTRYKEYFSWKQDYYIEDCNHLTQCGFCRLCLDIRNINQGNQISISQTYYNIKKWWIEDANCETDYGNFINEKFKNFEKKSRLRIEGNSMNGNH